MSGAALAVGGLQKYHRLWYAPAHSGGWVVEVPKLSRAATPAPFSGSTVGPPGSTAVLVAQRSGAAGFSTTGSVRFQFRPLALRSPVFSFRAWDLVHRLVEQPGHVKFVEGDLGRGQMLSAPCLKGRRHVDADFRHFWDAAPPRAGRSEQFLATVSRLAGRHMHHFRPEPDPRTRRCSGDPAGWPSRRCPPGALRQVGLRPRPRGAGSIRWPRVLLCLLPTIRLAARTGICRTSAGSPALRTTARSRCPAAPTALPSSLPRTGALRPRHPGMQVRLCWCQFRCRQVRLRVVRRAAPFRPQSAQVKLPPREVDTAYPPLLTTLSNWRPSPARRQYRAPVEQIRVPMMVPYVVSGLAG